MNGIPFQKISGAGNTFVVVDGRNLPPDTDLTALARFACADEREYGGADGFIVVSPSKDNNFEMRYFNKDGSTGMMCGNGGRCAVRFAADHGIVPDNDTIAFVNAGIPYYARLTERGVLLNFPDPLAIRPGETLMTEQGLLLYTFVDVGTPHVIIITNSQLGFSEGDFYRFDAASFGAQIRNHPTFVKNGVNVNFVFLHPEKNEIRLRTYERGVEAETGACGTGAIASGLVAAYVLSYGFSTPLKVIPTSNSPLWVDFTRGFREGVHDVSLEGGVDLLLEGELHFPAA